MSVPESINVQLFGCLVVDTFVRPSSVCLHWDINHDLDFFLHIVVQTNTDLSYTRPSVCRCHFFSCCKIVNLTVYFTEPLTKSEPISVIIMTYLCNCILLSLWLLIGVFLFGLFLYAREQLFIRLQLLECLLCILLFNN